MKYCQCKMRKGSTEATSWIPEKFAKKGKYLKLKGDNGWQVISVGTAAEEKSVLARERDFKKTRKASDIDRRKPK